MMVHLVIIDGIRKGLDRELIFLDLDSAKSWIRACRQTATKARVCIADETTGEVLKTYTING